MCIIIISSSHFHSAYPSYNFWGKMENCVNVAAEIMHRTSLSPHAAEKIAHVDQATENVYVLSPSGGLEKGL